MELDKQKIEETMRALDLTYQKIADILGIKYRQQVHEMVNKKREKHAKTFAQVFTQVGRFKFREQDFIKFDE